MKPFIEYSNSQWSGLTSVFRIRGMFGPFIIIIIIILIIIIIITIIHFLKFSVV
jgi:hypothetical protein